MSTYNTLERRRGFQADAEQEDLRKDLSMYALQQQSGYGVWDGSPNDRNGNQAGYYSGPLASVTTSYGSGSSGGMPGSGTGAGGVPTVTTNNNLQSQSEQLRYDPWAEHRPAAGDLLAGQMDDTGPSNLYQTKLAQMTNGQFTPDDPSYQFRFQQGQQAAERSAAARGLLNSGNAAIELQQYGQGMASQEYGAQFNRMLQGLSGVETAYDAQMGRLMKMAGVDIDPTAGGRLNVDQGQLGVGQGKLGLDAQQIANQYDIERRKLEFAQNNPQSPANWMSVFAPTSGASSNYQPLSWDAYFAGKDSASAAGRQVGTMADGTPMYRD